MIDAASTNSMYALCEKHYKALKDSLDKEGSKELIVDHFGEFTQDFVNSLTESMEDIMRERGDKKGTIKRMFNILVEALQNVRIHGEKDAEGQQIAFLVISGDEDKYNVVLSNLVKAENVEGLLDRIVRLNDMDEMQVKAEYMAVLDNGIISNKGGAGLGFITMKMKSKNVIETIVHNLDADLSLMEFHLTIARKK